MKKIMRVILWTLAVIFILASIGAINAKETIPAAICLIIGFFFLYLLLIKKIFAKTKDNSSVHRNTPPITKVNRRKNALAELTDFFKTRPKNLIVLDLETNGLTGNKSVLAVGAIKYGVDENNNLIEKERFVRYYFAKEREDPSAIIVNGLTKKKIEELRGENCNYPKYFYEDFSSFTDFCSDCLHYVIFNAKFDMQFIKHAEDISEYDWHIFDAMLTNTDIVCAVGKNGLNKQPNLKETLDFYGIEKKSSKLHAADYDAEMTAKIFIEMIKRAGLNK